MRVQQCRHVTHHLCTWLGLYSASLAKYFGKESSSQPWSRTANADKIRHRRPPRCASYHLCRGALALVIPRAFHFNPGRREVQAWSRRSNVRQHASFTKQSKYLKVRKDCHARDSSRTVRNYHMLHIKIPFRCTPSEQGNTQQTILTSDIGHGA